LSKNIPLTPFEGRTSNQDSLMLTTLNNALNVITGVVEREVTDLYETISQGWVFKSLLESNGLSAKALVKFAFDVFKKDAFTQVLCNCFPQ